MKKIVLLFGTILFITIASSKIAKAQTDDFDKGYAYGYGLGKSYAKSNVKEYKDEYVGMMPNGFWQRYERYAPCYSDYEGMQRFIAERIQLYPDRYAYFRGMNEGLYWGFKENMDRWKAIGFGGGGEIIPSEP